MKYTHIRVPQTYIGSQWGRELKEIGTRFWGISVILITRVRGAFVKGKTGQQPLRQIGEKNGGSLNDNRYKPDEYIEPVVGEEANVAFRLFSSFLPSFVCSWLKKTNHWRSGILEQKKNCGRSSNFIISSRRRCLRVSTVVFPLFGFSQIPV